MASDQKIALMHTAAVLTSLSLPNGSKEADIVTQHERWYQFLSRVALPDETVYTSPAAPAPTPQAAAGFANALAQAPDQLKALAAALAPLISAIPGAGAVAQAVSNVPPPNTPLPSVSPAPAPAPAK